MVGVALGHVRRGKPRDHAAVLRELDQLLQPFARREQVAVDQLHALRWPRRAGRVDQREHVAALRLSDRSLDVEVGIAALHVGERERALRRLAVDHDHVLEPGRLLARLQHLCQVLLLADQRLGFGVAQQVADLLRRVGVVDRERRRPEHHRREVAEMELGPVGEHQRDRLATDDAQLGQPSGERVDALAQLAPGDRERVALGADRDIVRALGGGDAKRLRHGARVDGRAPGALHLCDTALHLQLPPDRPLLPLPHFPQISIRPFCQSTR